MNNSDLLFSKRENGKIFLQEIFHAALRKCEKQLLLIKKENSPFIQKRILINSMYFSKMLLGRFLSLYRCYKSSKSHISTDVSKADIENIFQQTSQSMNTIFKALKKKINTFDHKMHRVINFIDFQKPNLCESRFIELILQDIPPDIYFKSHNRKLTFNHKQNLYNFTIVFTNSKKKKLSDIHIKWPKQISKLQREDIKFLVTNCQRILDTSGQFLIQLNEYIRSYYFYGEVLRISIIIHNNENHFGYQTQSNGNEIFIKYPNTFSPRNIFKLTTNGINGVFLQSCCSFSKLNLELDGINSMFLLSQNVYGLDDDEIKNLLYQTHQLVHFSKIKLIWKRFDKFFSSSNIGMLEIVDNMEIIQCNLFNILAFKIGFDFITGEPIVFYCLFSDIGKLLIKSMVCPDQDCSQYLRAFCASFFLKLLLNFPFEPHLKTLAVSDSFSIPSGKYITFNFGDSCKIVYDDTGMVPIIRSFSEGKDLQSTNILYFNSISKKHLNIKSLDFFFPTTFYDILNASVMRELVNSLKKKGVEIKYNQNELTFLIEPFKLIKFKIKYNYWQIHFIYPDISNAPNDMSIKIVGRFISSRFVPWLVFSIFRVTTFMQALKQVKNSTVVSKVIMYNSLFYKIEFNSSCPCIPITMRIDGLCLNHFGHSNKCEVYTLPSHWSNLQICCSIYQSILLKGYVNSLLKTSEALYRFGPFLTGFMIPLQEVFRVFLSDPNTQWIVTSVQEGFSFFLIYKRLCTLITIIRSSQTFQFILPHSGISAILQFAIPSSKFERCKQKFNSAIQVNISQLHDLKESIEEFFYERSLLLTLGFVQNDYIQKQPSPQIHYKGPSYCNFIDCTLDENGIQIIPLDNVPKNLKSIINVQIEGRVNRRRFYKFIFNTLGLGSKGNDFLKTLNDITEMPGHLLKWQKMVENDDALNVNLYDKSISMNLTTEFGHFYLVVYPDIDSVTISSDQGFQIEKVNTMNNMKSWFKRFVSDETTIPVDDNGNDHTYY